MALPRVAPRVSKRSARLFCGAAAALCALVWFMAPAIASADRIAYRASGGIWTADAATGESRALVPGTTTEWHALSPNGKQIAYTENEGTQLYVINTDGTGKQHLAPSVGVTPSWSPDGRSIVYVNHNPRRLFIVNVATDEIRELGGTGNQIDPCWSRDGRYIAFQSYPVEGQPVHEGLYYMNADGTGSMRAILVQPEGEYYKAYFNCSFGSRDVLALQTKANGEEPENVFTVHLDGTGLTQLTHDTEWSTIGNPVWNKPGTKITYSDDPSTAECAELRTMNADGSGNTSFIPCALEPSAEEPYLFGTPEPEPEELYGQTNPGEPGFTRSCAGKPVNCATGNETLTQTDLAVGGRGVGLNLTRTYNAQAATKASTSEPFGRGWSTSFGDHLVFNAEKGTIQVVQANGSAVVFKGAPGTVGVYSAPEWAQATLSFNGEHTYVYTLPDQESFKFNEAGQLTSEADRDGNVTSLAYNSGKQLETVTDPSGRKLTLAYNTEGFIASVKDPMGHTAKYAYEAGNLASVTLPGESMPRWQYKYDASHRLSSVTDGRGGATTNEYDASNRVISQTDPAERTLTFAYTTSEGGTPETKITNHATGAVTAEVFSSGFEPESITGGFGTASATTEKRSYDEAGSVRKLTDGNGHETEYSYSAAGDKTAEVDPNGHETKWTYDATHDVLSTTTPDGERTTITRDAHGNAEVIERPAPASKTQLTKYKYDAFGDLEAVTDPLERTTKYEYDSQGDRAAEIDAEGNKRTWEYNQDSQETTSVTPRGNAAGAESSKYTTKRELDEQGRVLAVTDSLGHRTNYTYDGDGNLETQTDANTNKTKYTYDADNEPTKVERPNGAVTETGYDGAGQVTSETDGNKHTTKYVRNGLEQVVEVVDPKERKTLEEYDKAGNLAKLTDAAKRVTTNTYDPANRLTEVAFSDGKTHAIKYEYNGDGFRIHISDASGETSYTYDQLDRMTESKDGHADIVKYEYDLANEQTKITYPNLKAVTRAFDKDGRLEKVTDWLEHTTRFAYDPDSELTTTTFPTGTSNIDSYAYNEADQMGEVKMSKGAETLASLAYARDSDGQLKTTTSKGLPGEESLSYTYDPNSRLTKGGAIGYEYDAADNATKVGTGSYTYDKADELEAGPSVKYAFNEVGERSKLTPTTGAATTYAYDESGNLIAIEKPKEGKVAGFTDTFTYDGNGLRVSQTISATKTYLAWQMTEALPLILSDGSNSYVYGPDGLPVEQVSSGSTVTYLHHDQQGSTRLITSATGTKEAAVTYDAYGNKTGSTGTATTPLGYDGQYTNSDTGLIYLRQRVYDPATGQFLSVDPLAKLTRAPYSYVEDNPVNAVDPTGLCSDQSVSGFLDCFNPVSNGNVAYKGATVLSSATGGVVNLPWLLTRPAVVDLTAAGVCATPGFDIACPGALGAAWSVSTSSVVANGIETSFCNPEQLGAEEGVTTLLFGFGALGVYTTGATEAAGAPGYARTIIRGGPAALEALLNGPLAAHGG